MHAPQRATLRAAELDRPDTIGDWCKLNRGVDHDATPTVGRKGSAYVRSIPQLSPVGLVSLVGVPQHQAGPAESVRSTHDRLLPSSSHVSGRCVTSWPGM